MIAREGLGADHQVLWYGPLAYALLLGLGGLAAGVALGVLPMERREIRGWTASLVLLALGVGPALMIAMFRMRRDVYPRADAAAAGARGRARRRRGRSRSSLFLFGPRLFAGGIGRAFGAIPALLLGALVIGGGAIAGRALYPAAPPPPTPPPVPAALADKPNLLLIVIDTLRADALSCYGGPRRRHAHLRRRRAGRHASSAPSRTRRGPSRRSRRSSPRRCRRRTTRCRRRRRCRRASRWSPRCSRSTATRPAGSSRTSTSRRASASSRATTSTPICRRTICSARRSRRRS